MLVFDDSQSDFYIFIKSVVQEYVTPLLTPPQEQVDPSHPTTFGFCNQPFGIVRIRAVEFLSEAYKVFFKDLHSVFEDCQLYDSLLFFFDHYPFHNILHQKVNEIFMTALDKNQENVVNNLLYNTSLIRKILETSRDNGSFVFESKQSVSRGYMIFVRKLANKLIELKAKNEEVVNFLDSIPEWQEYEEGALTRFNDIENKPLPTDPRNKTKQKNNDDDYFDLVYKFKDSHRSGFGNKKQEQDEEEEDEVEVEIEETNENQEEQQQENNNDQESMSKTINKKSRNSTGTSHRRNGY